MSAEPLALYVHWPFCVSKCPYCDFNSHVRSGIDQEEWRAALLADLAHEARLLPGRQLTSIFFGGGTPSLMEPATAEAIVDAATSYWSPTRDIEITLEANPNSVESARFADLARAGVNRLSLGLQSFDDGALHFLGRAHSATEGFRALEIAERTFRRVSFDLIYALPGDTQESWSAMLAQALSLGTSHLSLYQLTIEPDTPFFGLHRAGKLTVPDQDLARDLYDLTQTICTDAGLPAYEISNHARPGAQCRHNLVYWRGHDYAGIGPGAHGRLTIDNARIATETEKRPEAWLMRVEETGTGLTVEEKLTSGEAADEYLLMGLRLAEGIDLARYSALSGRNLNPRRVSILRNEGAVETTADGRLRVTQSGFPLLDAVVADLAA